MNILIYSLIVLINVGVYYACIRDARKSENKPEIKYTGTHRFHKHSGAINTPPRNNGRKWIEMSYLGGFCSLLLYLSTKGAEWRRQEPRFFPSLLIIFLFWIVPLLGVFILMTVYHREYYDAYTDKFRLFCWKLSCLGASERDFLDETKYRTVRAPNGDSIFGYDSLTKGGKKTKIEDGAKVEVLAFKGSMAGCVVVEEETVCWIDKEYLTEDNIYDIQGGSVFDEQQQ